MQTLFLLAEIAGTEVAICSDNIESVVTVGEVINVPKSDPVVAGLFALRSRVLTLIDCQYRITGHNCPSPAGSLAAVANISGHSFGLLVSKVHDVVTVSADRICPALKLGAGWASVVSQFVEIDGRLIMILDPDRLVAADLHREAA